jgi:hypothetical protein
VERDLFGKPASTFSGSCSISMSLLFRGVKSGQSDRRSQLDSNVNRALRGGLALCKWPLPESQRAVAAKDSSNSASIV